MAIPFDYTSEYKRKLCTPDEAARRCIRYALEERNLPAVYSYMKYDNLASCRVAQKNGMRLVETYPDDRNTFTRVYAITREEWLTTHVSAPNE